MRVSSADDRQSVDPQRVALIAASVNEQHLHTDKANGAGDDRPCFNSYIEGLRTGDCLVAWKLDRLGGSLRQLLTIINDLKVRGVAYRSLTYQMDTTTPHWELLPYLLGAPPYERANYRSLGQQRDRTFNVPHSALIDTLARSG